MILGIYSVFGYLDLQGMGSGSFVVYIWALKGKPGSLDPSKSGLPVSPPL